MTWDFTWSCLEWHETWLGLISTELRLKKGLVARDFRLHLNLPEMILHLTCMHVQWSETCDLKFRHWRILSELRLNMELRLDRDSPQLTWDLSGTCLEWLQTWLGFVLDELRLILDWSGVTWVSIWIQFSDLGLYVDLFQVTRASLGLIFCDLDLSDIRLDSDLSWPTWLET